MAYADRETITHRTSRYLPRATDPEVAAGQKHADARINGRLSAVERFRSLVPFTTVPDFIESIAADLAAAFILNDLFEAGDKNEPTDYAAFLEKRGMDELEALCKANADLPADELDPEADPPPSGVAFRRGTPGPLSVFDGRTIPDHALFRPWGCS